MYFSSWCVGLDASARFRDFKECRAAAPPLALLALCCDATGHSYPPGLVVRGEGMDKFRVTNDAKCFFLSIVSRVKRVNLLLYKCVGSLGGFVLCLLRRYSWVHHLPIYLASSFYGRSRPLAALRHKNSDSAIVYFAGKLSVWLGGLLAKMHQGFVDVLSYAYIRKCIFLLRKL